MDGREAIGVRFIGSEIYRTSSYGRGHPLAIPRVSTCIDLCRALGWLPDAAYLDSPVASPDQLARFHDRAYIQAVIDAERSQRATAAERQRYNIGRNGNPIFPEMFRRPATACGGSLLAAAELLAGRSVFSPAGGTHHGRPGRASGFCYFNDPVLAILALLDAGLERVLYLDVDAHHGDGVQDAFADDARVFTLSIHESERWPMRPGAVQGRLSDRAGGAARNLPVPAGLNDAEFGLLVEQVVWPLAEDFAPDALVLQCGTDALQDDPQSKLCLSNRAIWRLVKQARGFAQRLLVLGGGGYNPWSVARCWTGLWASLNSHDLPDRLPREAEAVLRAITWRHSRGRNPPESWFTCLADRPNDGPIRGEIRALAQTAKAP